ncbi:hypothetical protein WA171_000611 [Blastocystis sp. BT1]
MVKHTKQSESSVSNKEMANTPSPELEVSKKAKKEKKTKGEEKSRKEEPVTLPPSTSLFSDANKVKFSKPSEPAIPSNPTPVTKIEKKKPVNKHAQDDFTVFVGNLPTDIIAKPQTLKKAFSVFGEVKTLRFRSISVESTPISSFDKKLLKKAAIIQNKLSDEKKSVNAYIVFENKDSVAKALSLNNTVLLGRHIVVDTVGKKEHTDKDANSRTLFVGNLPFKCDEEELREFFEKGMQEQKTRNGLKNQETMVQSVRLIRTKDTQRGKGIGYVVLTSGIYMPLALLLNNSKFGDREIRVTRYLSNPVAIEKQKERDAARNGRKNGKKQSRIGKPTPQNRDAAKKVIEKMKKEETSKEEKKEKLPKEKKEKIAKEKPQKEKKEGEKKEKKSMNLSFMGRKASLNMNSINAVKRLMKKAKK